MMINGVCCGYDHGWIRAYSVAVVVLLPLEVVLFWDYCGDCVWAVEMGIRGFGGGEGG